ncbi:Short chain enoyl-CoA hydratase /3-hydroxyacyl-CoA dehydrogenase [Bosea sp. 62]|uniref:3-hydroxyacyl-CoA dehydrogenase NAD-binding domain-containing protein n=1 Tax=unclassified Bosea (in: a-proteobacteria) TaxID=2653178 RepID=UPI00125BBC1E|nr:MULTISPECIES: 3-hydroxyacyl-CoA dehydrogenase NAD-binding domain-containing protein [unclassified Bosea (in: a-proteobacteria)]CAD5250639.1 Short chain enoyl-CoA hydratase /3-hydroxyacyl-CoA dehydrogenase [Bosea sp. 21B]CAD5263602.1 Short chain enoyl-CoA hydratase /3-hydroxyacyl-CoA dehydrogenase [Bosea sp. 7B]CAD5271116.1 Short chain enoyl-CoA hydratase /3-hydroxyacyl-CoA dehydrogenase [Bosea sp. 46]VVT43991.1 Short chain enoyl-CoA hydratase /3-hydroxyacyl-CoA dehydrogenase [Bosea sp. EC-HK
MPTVTLTRQGEIAIATLDNPPVNALSAALRADLAAVLAQAMADQAVTALVIAAKGRAFIAGADISEFGKPPAPPILPDLLAMIENAPKPVIAATEGVALGGGLEVALACHGRVASPAAKLGLPEIKLGLIPGAGGTQRLPRLIGATAAFPMMLSGEPIPAQKALALGLVDKLVDSDAVGAAVALAQELAGKGAPAKTSARSDKLTAAEREAFEALAKDALAKSGEMPNVAALVEAVRAALTLPLAEGFATERALFVKLLGDERSKALRYVFFAEREAAKVPGIDESVKPRPIARAAVIGAGTMGGGIAMCFANAGIPVTLIETTQEQIDKGHARVRDTYGFSVKRGSMTEAVREQRMALITPAVGLAAAAEADIVIEAAFEEMGVKRDIFGALDTIAKPGAILASNTSYLDLAEIAAVTSRPADVLGLHFFSPANVMKLLEIVRPAGVANDVVATALALGRKLGKVPVVVGNCFGFVGNRILEARTRAAERLLVAGALPHEVDAALTDFGFKMGPFAMSDLAGNDISWRSRKARGKSAAVADAICERGWFGQKTGRGYYRYPEGARAGERDPEVEALIAEVSASKGVTRRSFTADEILARLLDPMVNEGARILDEGIATRAGDIDTVWLNGYNWPAWRGGPMHWAESVGFDVIVKRLEQQAVESGDASLEPAPMLRKLAAEGKGFG